MIGLQFCHFPSPSLYNISQSLHSNMKEAQNLITDNNDIQEGLNFIVPSLWWKNFLTENAYIKNIKSIKIEHADPLDSLYQLGIIQKQPSDLESSFNGIVRQAQAVLKGIKRQLRQAEKVVNDETSSKRNRLPCSWLDQTTDFQTSNFDILLYSPQVNQEMVQLFEMGDQHWVLVAPQLYRLIWLNWLQNTKQKTRNKLTAIPVIMKKRQIQNCYKPINFYHKQNVEVFFNNVSGYSFAFKGSIDADLQIQELIKYLDDGLFRLIGGCKVQKNLQESNKVIHIPDIEHIFYEFQSDQPSEVLPWTEFRDIKYSTLQSANVRRINVFSASYPSNKAQNQNQQIIEPISTRTRKKRKGDFTVCKSQNGERKRAGVRDINGAEINTRIDFAQEPNDVHSSTQEQTPLEQRQQRNVIIIQNSTNLSANRITYPLWREGHQTEKLLKYAQVRISIPKIFRPYSDQPVLVLKDEGKKIVLPRRCNELMVNEVGELMQKQLSQQQAELPEQAPTQSIRRQLQMLALQIQGIKISEMVEEAEKVEQLVKEKEQNQIKTSKNEFMDELDCEQSRQF